MAESENQMPGKGIGKFSRGIALNLISQLNHYLIGNQ
jgi:hypothetical protein